MKKEKKELTVVQTKNRYRAFQYLCHGGEYLSILTPYIIMGSINFDEWFVQNPEGWKVGLGGSLALALLGIATFFVSKNKEDKKTTDGYIALIVGWFAVAFILMLLASVINEMATIMFYGGIGLAGAFGLDMVSKDFKKKADMYKLAIEEAKGKDIQEKFKKELVEKAKKEQIAVD